SKARVEALANSRHVLDFQTAFDRPYQFMALSEQATIEWGNTGDANPHAEGGFVKRHGDDSAFGAYFGRRSADFSEAVQTVRDASSHHHHHHGSSNPAFADLMFEQNGLNLFYASKMGEWTWGVTAKYSNGKNEDPTVGTKATSAGVAVAASNGTWDFELVQGFTGKSELDNGTVTAEVESKGLTNVTVGYHMSPEMEVYGNVKMSKVEADLNGTPIEVETTSYKVGMVNTLAKSEEGNFFYGVEVASTKVKDDSESLLLPVYMGVEHNAASWLVLRASVAQNVILNETKDDATGNKTDEDSTRMAAGAGIKFGKSVIDASFAGSTTGVINANNLFSQVAYTYTF
uniref:Major outer membrane protein n=1 Tax=Bdellovibrio bacteriovorus (strain ATCC 15356 / DSM 50701 / NCIMB 9529 / HD100) TaxID=264462 RepID=UPI003F77876E